MRASAIIKKENAVLLMRREREGRVYYVLPGGTVEDGETPEAACVREVLEETGLAVESIVPIASEVENGRIIQTFRILSFRGTAMLGGPERERNGASNRYVLEWVDAARLDRIELFPVSARRLLRALDLEPDS